MISEFEKFLGICLPSLDYSTPYILQKTLDICLLWILHSAIFHGDLQGNNVTDLPGTGDASLDNLTFHSGIPNWTLYCYPLVN